MLLYFVKILHLAIARCKIMTNIMPTHVKISIEPGIRELFLNYKSQKGDDLVFLIEGLPNYDVSTRLYLQFHHFSVYVIVCYG